MKLTNVFKVGRSKINPIVSRAIVSLIFEVQFMATIHYMNEKNES